MEIDPIQESRVMSFDALPPDDQPPASSSQLSTEDIALRRQLEDVIGRQFYDTCDGVLQGLLMQCEWYLTTQAVALTLVIRCPDQSINWRVLNNVVAIAGHLEPFSERARIRLCPPPEVGEPFEIRIDEISVYRDAPQ